MMDANAVRKSYEIQQQVRNNADELKMTLTELYSWQKKIKEQEIKVQNEPEPEVLEPPRTQLLRKPQAGQDAGVTRTSSNAEEEEEETEPEENEDEQVLEQEKMEVPVDPNEEKRKRANECKDAGNRSVKLQKYEQAIEHYDSAIEIYPEDPIYYTNRAFCHLKLEDFVSCILDCGQAIALDRGAVKAYYRRMQANESLGNTIDALKDCQAVLTLEPRNGEAKKSLQRINERLKREATSVPKKPRFSPDTSDLVDIKPIFKLPHQRSNKPLIRVPISDVITPTPSADAANLKISDEDIDKLFNSNCGPFVEVKKPKVKEVSSPHEKQHTAKTPINKEEEITKPETPKVDDAKVKNIEASVRQLLHDRYKALRVEELPTTSKAAAKELPQATSASPVGATSGKEPPAPNQRTVPPPPTSSAQFYGNWSELNPEQRFQYLKSIRPSLLLKLLGASFNDAILTDILFTIRDYYLPHKEPSTAETMLHISQHDQIRILSCFLSKDARSAVMEILESIKDNQAKAVIAQKFEINI